MAAILPSASSLEYIEEVYHSWEEDPSSVDPQWSEYFSKLSNGDLESLGFTKKTFVQTSVSTTKDRETDSTNPDAIRVTRGKSEVFTDTDDIKDSHSYKQSRVNSLIWAYRDIGYLYADLNPLKGYITPELWYMMFAIEGDYGTLKLESFNLSDADLDTVFFAGRYAEPRNRPLRDIVDRLKKVYCNTFGPEFLHIQNRAMRTWLLEHIEGRKSHVTWESDKKISFLKDLIKAEELEHFIHSNFIGQKRFSLEGGEALVPALRYLFDSALNHNVDDIVLGMAHRGRLNVFINAMGMPAVDIFSRFVDNYAPHTYGGSGDVKYHLGFSIDYSNDDTRNPMHISLVANPSHLEAVNPVVEGKARGIQRKRKDRHRKHVIPVLIHGDSAFSGQGVVAETLNLSQLKGYKTGGTIHIIVNNQIGFTTASRDSRSTFFTTDIAKSISIPIFHVNGDDPEAVARAMDIAIRFRQKFSHDVIIDIICYRRLGHNEADEPSFTHPKMYEEIKKHKSARVLYGERLDKEKVWLKKDQDDFAKSYIDDLTRELEAAKTHVPMFDTGHKLGIWTNYSKEYSFDEIVTQVDKKTVEEIATKLVAIPEDFQIHPKLRRFSQGRHKQFFDTKMVDWAFAESLALGSLLIEGYPIRLSGEDCRRGTFSQRHVVWWDVKSPVPKSHVPLRTLSKDQAWFSVYDSPLSEFSVLGFDYGYSLATPNSMTIWEAQFGDFVNGAQVIIDQFIASAETKWFRSSGLIMLLPHGMEGQGPEHSSAHLERFLSLCADNNLQIINVTTPAQYFHILRKQMHQNFRKPMIIMTPKSLLRHKEAVSPVEDFSEKNFSFVLDDADTRGDEELILLCSGKVYYDLIQGKKERKSSAAIIRLEQLYPYPEEALKKILSKYSKVKNIRWVQEETKNRGAWPFIQQFRDDILPGLVLEYVGRVANPSPATGSHKQHVEELEELMNQAFA